MVARGRTTSLPRAVLGADIPFVRLTCVSWRSRAARIGEFLLCVTFVARCASGPIPSAQPAPESAPRVQIGRIDGVRGAITLPLDEYVAGVVAAELGVSLLRPATLQVARLQAVLARTYALSSLNRHQDEGFDLCATTHCQLFRPLHVLPRPNVAVAREAAHSTREILIVHKGQPIEALYHADCGGHTSNASAVWGGDGAPYLRGVVDAMCPGPSKPPWRFAVDANTLESAINADSRTRVGGQLRRVEVVARDKGGRALRVALDGDRSSVVRAEEFRLVVIRRFGPRSLRSTRFSVARRDGQFVFEGGGNGHGVGLCIAGAIAQISAGRRLETVIGTYYTGAQVHVHPPRPTQGPVPLVSPKPRGYNPS